MPKQGVTVESCVILGWRKHEGETIKTGDIICEVETDKAAFEVEAEHEGTLLKIFFEAGADVPVLTPIAVVGQPGEDIRGLIPNKQYPPLAPLRRLTGMGRLKPPSIPRKRGEAWGSQRGFFPPVCGQGR